VQFENEEEALDYLISSWATRWNIRRDPHGEWVADRLDKLDEDEILGGLEMSLVANDLQSLHRQLNEQDRIEHRLLDNP
jgi:hypothetical protein